MEEQPGRVILGKLFFKTKQQRTCKINGKYELMNWTEGKERTKGKDKYSYLSCCQSLEMPMHTVEFLCRSWSPSASNFLQAFSAKNQVWDLEDKHSLGAQGEKKIGDDDRVRGEEEKDADDEVEQTKGHLDLDPRNRFEDLAEKAWMNLKPTKVLLKQKSLTGFLRRYRVKDKEELQLVAAKMHVALSVAQLAAAISVFVSTEHASDTKKEGRITRDMIMRNIIAYAAALVATACAESAESAGADKAHVASAVNCGLAAQSSADIMTLIATASTSTLESRAMPGLSTTRIKKPVKLEAKLSTIFPSGQKLDRFVSIRSQHGLLRLSLQKKYLGIAMTKREYTILNVTGEKRVQGCCLLSLKCDGGEIKLLFQDEEQSLVWMSNISSVLCCADITMTTK